MLQVHSTDENCLLKLNESERDKSSVFFKWSSVLSLFNIKQSIQNNEENTVFLTLNKCIIHLISGNVRYLR